MPNVEAGATDGRGAARRALAVLALALGVLSACQGVGQQPGADFDPLKAADVPQNPALAEGRDSLAEGQRALEARDYERAYKIFRKHVVIDPKDEAAKLGLARAYLGRGESHSALTVLDTLAEGGRKRPEASVLRGLALLSQGRLTAARRQFEEAAGKDPTLWRAWNGLGLIDDAEGKWRQAEESYRKALEADASAAVVHNNLGYSYLLQGKADAAAGEFGEALSHDADLDVARQNLRLALAAKGRYVSALAGAQKRELPKVLNNIGYMAMLRGDYAAAETYFNRAIAESPTYYDAAVQNLDRLKLLQQADRERALQVRPGS